jgi:hypothetical protein
MRFAITVLSLVSKERSKAALQGPLALVALQFANPPAPQ